jgi:hypothetical protein
MPSAVRLLATLALCATAGLAACGEGPSVPGQPLSGRYLLRTVDGRPLPCVFTSGGLEEYTTLSESITFDPSGAATHERTMRQVSRHTGRDTTYTLVDEAAYRQSGARVEIGRFRPCPPNAFCPANDVGTLRGADLVLTSSMYNTGSGARPILVFTRP